MMTKLQGACLFLQCVIFPLLLIAGPACLLYLVQQCYTQKNTTFQQIVSHLLQGEERIEPNNTAHITTRIIQMLQENTENITKEEKHMNQVENKTSIRDCEIYLLPILIFYYFMCFRFIYVSKIQNMCTINSGFKTFHTFFLLTWSA